MARTHIILQGFVDINLETDENVNTKIGYKKQQELIVKNIDINPVFLNVSKLKSASDKIELPVDIESVFENIGVNIESIQLASVKGSRLYGVDGVGSDWDLIAISTDISGNVFRETNIDGNDFDVHIFSQEDFQNKLDNHEMREIESLSYPENFIIIDNKTFSVDIDSDKLINKVKFESDDLWNIAKSKFNSNGDLYRAVKEIWHSFRLLIFAEQILKDGSITDFGGANYLYETIINSKQTDFEFFESNFSTLRETLKLNLDIYKEDGGLELIEFSL